MMDTPAHPTVDWSTAQRGPTGTTVVQVLCPMCPTPRPVQASLVRLRIKQGQFNGRCYSHRKLNRERSTYARGPRKPRLSHPAVDWTDTKMLPTSDGREVTCVAVTCPSCRQRRYARPGAVSSKIRQGRFTGLCLPCSPNARKREWTRLGPGRKLDPVKGYVRLSLEAVAPEDYWLFLAMRRASPTVTEHRMVMAKKVGRPLTSDELVDHMDGDKTNNDPSNLRLYRRGRNEPGDIPGFGTFYHEWQLAETEIRRLRERLAHCS